MSSVSEADRSKEAVLNRYWYNLAPKDGSDPSTAPANKLYGYNVRVYGIDIYIGVKRVEEGDRISPLEIHRQLLKQKGGWFAR